ncbi:hypothetical protein [Brevibacillus sp. 179-C9.3 HS]|uniref:hypothetical protein n=1 Tax=unclassified Brevibacillus TaxID=2684853 RepID=UPI0039A37CDC
MNKSYITSFGKEPSKAHCIERKVGWPLYVWKALVPESMIGEVDILQRFVLSLAHIDRLKDHTIFHSLALSSELVEAVKLSCIEKNYLDKNGKITEAGKAVLSGEVIQRSDASLSENYQKICVFRDALTGDIVPHFSIQSLPRSREEQSDRWLLPYNKAHSAKPNFNELAHAVKIRKFIERNVKSAQQDYAAEKVDSSTSGLELPFDLTADDEVDWEQVGNDGEVAASLEEQQNARPSSRNAISSRSYIKIWDDTPELIYADASLYIDPDMPNRLFTASPFDAYENVWFTNHLLNQANRDEAIQSGLDGFVKMALEELREKYPLNNHLDIELFVRFPAIANQPEYKELKEQLESVKRAYNRISDGHMDYDTFYLRCQRTLECLLDYCIAKIDKRQELAGKVQKYDFPNRIRDMAMNLSIDLPSNYGSPQFADRMEKVARMRGNSSKDRALFLLLDAHYRKDSASLMVFRDMPEFFQSINLVAEVRNKTAHYNKETIDHDTSTERVMERLELLVIVLFSHFLRR